MRAIKVRHFLLCFQAALLLQLIVQNVVWASPVTSDELDLTSAHKIRALHVVARLVSPKDMNQLIDKAHQAHFNHLIISFADGVKLDSAPKSILESAWTKAELLSIVKHARSLGMEVIPEIKLLTHQEKFFKNHYLELMYNQFTYDPRLVAVYDIVYLILDEVIDIIHPKAIHIGHDEVIGWNVRQALKLLLAGERMLPADLFLKNIQRIHRYLKGRGVATWMWGDMLISQSEFPKMLVRHLHGGATGYGRSLRKKIPKDIVICDWHYFDEQRDFPSLSVLKREGFRTLGATWKNEDVIYNFSKYAATHDADGMIATTWFHVQHKEWNITDQIIKTSGKVFLKDFPDAK